MIMYNFELLIVKSSDVIDFYRIEEDPHADLHLPRNLIPLPNMPQQPVKKSHNFTWVKYHTLQHKGFVNMTPDTNQFHIVCDDLIYFYEFPIKTCSHDDDLKIPELKNTMYNFMRCNNMMIDKKERFCLTYKT